MPIVTFRAERNDWENWKYRAGIYGVTLSEYIRQRCSNGDGVITKRPTEAEILASIPKTLPNPDPAFARKPCKHGMLFCKKCK